MAYKLIEAAQSRRRAVNAPHLVALVRAGARFENGRLVERQRRSDGGVIWAHTGQASWRQAASQNIHS